MSARTGLLGLGLLFLFACSEGPTEYEPPLLTTDAPAFSQGATGANAGLPEDQDLAASDANDDGIVCVKVVPGGNGKAAPRTIVKDNKDDGSCPGGFEPQTLGLPACTHLQPITECDCEAAGGFVIPGTNLCATFGGG